MPGLIESTAFYSASPGFLTLKHGSKFVCSKMAAKHPHAVQKELTSFFAFSQSGAKKAKGLFKIVLCLDIEMAFISSLSVRSNFHYTETDIFQCYDKLSRPCNVMHYK